MARPGQGADHLARDFDRIVVSHGRNVETGGKTMLREAFVFLK